MSDGPVVLRNPATQETITVPSEAAVPFFPAYTERVTEKETAAVLSGPADPNAKKPDKT